MNNTDSIFFRIQWLDSWMDTYSIPQPAPGFQVGWRLSSLTHWRENFQIFLWKPGFLSLWTTSLIYIYMYISMTGWWVFTKFNNNLQSDGKLYALTFISRCRMFWEWIYIIASVICLINKIATLSVKSKLSSTIRSKSSPPSTLKIYH